MDDDDDVLFRQVVDELPDLVCRFAPDGTLLYVNRAYAEYFGSTPERLIGTNFLDLVPRDERSDAEAALAAVTALTPTDPVRRSVHRGGDRHGRVRWQEWVDKATFDGAGRLVSLLAVGRDVTDRVAAQERLHFLAERDPLTGLLNRRVTLATLDRLVSAPPGEPGRPGIVYADIDRFKRTNDRFGHRTGDRVLAHVAEVLTASFLPTDHVGRIGGDEFVVICPYVRCLTELDERCARAAARLAAMDPPVRASFGAVLSEGGESAEGLLHRADLAMYERKSRRVADRSAVSL